MGVLFLGSSNLTELIAKSISQHKMRRYHELLEVVAELKNLKAEIIRMAQDGLCCQPGPLSVNLSTRAGQRRPAWKEHYLALASELVGVDQAKEMFQGIIDDTPLGKESVRLDLVDRDNPLG